jgi:hypothetical protein
MNTSIPRYDNHLHWKTFQMHARSNKRHAFDDDEMTFGASRSLGYVLKRDNKHENVQKVDYLGEQRY